MSTVNITFRVDKELKNQASQVMEAVGLNMSSAFTVFLKAIVREGGLPDGVAIDPFYSLENYNELKRRVQEYESGNVNMIRTTMEEIESWTSS